MLQFLHRQKKNITFQQDGAPPHIAKPVREFIARIFRQKVFSRFFPQSWPARSPDLNPADFWLWGMLKQRVYRRKPGNLAEMKSLITEEISKITVDELLNATSNILDRLHLIIANGGRHIEHVL